MELTNAVLKTLYTSPVNSIYAISQDPEHNDFCIWRGDSYVMGFDTLPEAIQYCENFIKANRGQ